jgi:carotenoid cleavage dioxygenase-like enzyme
MDDKKKNIGECLIKILHCRKSETVIIDAKTMASEPVGVVNLPTRVPVGFHSIFVSQVCTLASFW